MFEMRKATSLFAEKATSLFAEKPTSLFAKKTTLLFPAYSYGDNRPFFASSYCQTMISCTVKRIFSAGCGPGCLSYYRFYLFVPVIGASAFFLPALSLFPGHIPAHEAR